MKVKSADKKRHETDDSQKSKRRLQHQHSVNGVLTIDGVETLTVETSKPATSQTKPPVELKSGNGMSTKRCNCGYGHALRFSIIVEQRATLTEPEPVSNEDLVAVVVQQLKPIIDVVQKALVPYTLQPVNTVDILKVLT